MIALALHNAHRYSAKRTTAKRRRTEESVSAGSEAAPENVAILRPDAS